MKSCIIGSTSVSLWRGEQGHTGSSLCMREREMGLIWKRASYRIDLDAPVLKDWLSRLCQ